MSDERFTVKQGFTVTNSDNKVTIDLNLTQGEMKAIDMLKEERDGLKKLLVKVEEQIAKIEGK